MNSIGNQIDDPAFKKRNRDNDPSSNAGFFDQNDKEKGKNRGNYMCSRCNLPKKGHVCPHQPKYKRRDQINEAQIANMVDCSIQCELDFEMTVRTLGALDLQGTPDSYIPIPLPNKFAQKIN